MNALGKFTTASLSACLMLGTAGTQASASEVSSVPPGPSTGLEHVRSEPAGQYYYSCTATNGSVYWLTPGEPTTNCRGSYLGKYINGARVASYNLTEGGMRAAPPGRATCRDRLHAGSRRCDDSRPDHCGNCGLAPVGDGFCMGPEGVQQRLTHLGPATGRG